MPSSVGDRGDAHEKSGAGSPVVIAMPDDGSHVGADEKLNKNVYLAKYTKGLNYIRIVKYLSFILAMVGIVILAVQVCKGKSLRQHHKRSKVGSNANPSWQTRTQSRSSTTRWAPHLVSRMWLLRITLAAA